MKRKSLDDPDEFREFPLGSAAFSSLGTFTIGRGVLQPGFRWSAHLSPIMGTPSCPVHHMQLVLAGRCRVRMDDGEELEFAPNDLMEIPPGHDIWVVGDEPLELLDFAGNIGALGVPQEHERIVVTLLMTDIVDSTRTAGRLGDRAWKQVLTDHNRLVRQQIARFGGHEVNTTGDGFLATFTSAVGALRCALGARDAVRDAGLSIRTGIHTGEVEVIGRDVGGIAVHTVARIMSLASASEVLVSSVAAGLADGSGLAFEDRGRHEVKGLSRPIEVLRVTS
ncbi:MAG: adenylate/guanylate cyclase domain-containing protein [Candidatus Limnocylindria bacterium]